MKLAEYIKSAGLSNAAFSRMTGLSQGTVSLLCRGLVWPSDETLATIEEVTKRKVRAKDFGGIWPSRRKQRTRLTEPAAP